MRRAQVVGDNSTGKASAIGIMRWSRKAMRAILGQDDRWRGYMVVGTPVPSRLRPRSESTMEQVWSLSICTDRQGPASLLQLTTDEATT